ncbi:Phage integrase family [Popillia japonica]|uniref:Phage integrase family n=1 Tax=Popillia japonica TaxID=7064 RepID=A0AAW1MZV5_POPJA
MKPSTLWSQYSVLRSTLDIKKGIDMSKYSKLRAFLKRQSGGYLPKKSRVFTKEQVDNFLNNALDYSYLMQKVVLVLGVAGAMRCDEIVKLRIDNVEDVKSALIIKIPDTKTKRSRSFTVLGENYLCVYRKYIALRPPSLVERRLFLRYVNGMCLEMVVGIHKISAAAQEVATFLKLDNWKEYTGHALRRTSATLLVKGGGDFTCLK